MSESAAALLAQQHFEDFSYDRTQLLAELKEAHAADPQDVGVTWRLVRAAFDVSALPSTSANDQKDLIYYAYDLIQKALEQNDKICYVHNWYGIILGRVGKYEGTKVALSNSRKIREHWEKSIELNPSHPVAYHLLGRWCLRIAELSTVERAAAAVIFAEKQPKSSSDEALTFLLKSEGLNKDASVPVAKSNAFAIAEAYHSKKELAKAKEWAEKAVAFKINTPEDANIHKDAEALLNKC